MKIFICLLATVYTANATLLSLLGGGGSGGGGGGGGGSSGGGGSHVTYNVVATPSHGGGHGGGHSGGHGGGHSGGHGGYAEVHSHSNGHGYGHSSGVGLSPQIIKVILEQSQGYASGYAHGSDYGAAAGIPVPAPIPAPVHIAAPVTEIFKVIHQQTPSLAPAPLPLATPDYSYGHNYASGHQNYAAIQSIDENHHNYASSGHSGSGISLEAILPQILQLVLQDNSNGGLSSGGAYNDQLIAHFGAKGKAIIMQNKGNMDPYFSSGHVVERGTLKVMQVQESSGQAHADSGASSGLFGGLKSGGGGGGGGVVHQSPHSSSW